MNNKKCLKKVNGEVLLKQACLLEIETCNKKLGITFFAPFALRMGVWGGMTTITKPVILHREQMAQTLRWWSTNIAVLQIFIFFTPDFFPSIKTEVNRAE